MLLCVNFDGLGLFVYHQKTRRKEKKEVLGKMVHLNSSGKITSRSCSKLVLT